MNESKFLKEAEGFLIKISSFIEEHDKNSIFEVEYNDGILNIILFGKNQQYVINKHNASKKIWFSSPVSGADYFSFTEGKWINSAGKELSNKLYNELNSNFNFNI